MSVKEILGVTMELLAKKVWRIVSRAITPSCHVSNGMNTTHWTPRKVHAHGVKKDNGVMERKHAKQSLIRLFLTSSHIASAKPKEQNAQRRNL